MGIAAYEHLSSPNRAAQQRLRKDCLGTKPKFHANLRQVNGKNISYVTYFFTYSTFLALPTLYVENIFVLKDYCRQGIGKKLFDYLKDLAMPDGYGRIEFIA